MPYESPILDAADPLVLIRARLIDAVGELIERSAKQDEVAETVDRIFYKPMKGLETENSQ